MTAPGLCAGGREVSVRVVIFRLRVAVLRFQVDASSRQVVVEHAHDSLGRGSMVRRNGLRRRLVIRHNGQLRGAVGQLVGGQPQERPACARATSRGCRWC